MTEQHNSGKPLEILLIDDENIVAESLAIQLRKLGVKVTTTTGCEEGIRIYNERLETGKPYHAVITDLNMPGKGGYVVVEEIKRQDREKPVYIMSGKLLEDIERYFSKSEFKPDGILQKPIEVEKLDVIVRGLKARYKIN